MVANKRAEQKLVSFTDNPTDLERISNEIANGWNIVSLSQNAGYYVGIVEKTPTNNDIPVSEQTVFIPPRRKLKFHN